jgi:hypothetical protein
MEGQLEDVGSRVQQKTMKIKHTYGFGGVLVVRLRVPIHPSYLAQVEVNSFLCWTREKMAVGGWRGTHPLGLQETIKKKVAHSRGADEVVETH